MALKKLFKFGLTPEELRAKAGTPFSNYKPPQTSTGGTSYKEPPPLPPKRTAEDIAAGKSEAKDWIREREKAKTMGYGKREAGEIATARTEGKEYLQVKPGEREATEAKAREALKLTQEEIQQAKTAQSIVAPELTGFQRDVSPQVQLAQRMSFISTVIDKLTGVKRLVFKGTMEKGDMNRIDNAEKQYTDALTQFKDELEYVKTGQKPMLDAREELVYLKQTLAVLASAEKGLGKTDYNYWKDLGLSREVDLDNKRQVIADMEMELINYGIAGGYR